jgi:SAM-dependent methyltransferase
MARSHSSLEDVPLLEKWRQAVMFFRWRLASGDDPKQLDPILESLDRVAATYERLTGKRFADARVFEIGYGARPVRLIALSSMGIDVRGIDLDAPMMRFSVPRLLNILKTNGPVRALKTAVRNLLFDRKDQKVLDAAMRLRGHSLRIDPKLLLVGDAAQFDFREDKYDLIYSFDVFEHIPPGDLEALVKHLATALTEGGIAVVVPFVYTGSAAGICRNGSRTSWTRT